MRSSFYVFLLLIICSMLNVKRGLPRLADRFNGKMNFCSFTKLSKAIAVLLFLIDKGDRSLIFIQFTVAIKRT